MIAKAGKYLFTVLVLLIVSFAANAQRLRRRIIVVPVPPPGYYSPGSMPVQQKPYAGQARVRKAKEEFISKALLLSPEQTNLFLNVYRHWDDERGAIRVFKKINLQSEPNADQFNKDAEYDRQLFEIKNKYRQEFLKIMPPDKVAMIYKAEDVFNREVLKNLTERGGGPATVPPRN